MALIVFKVLPRLNKWSVVHNDVPLATFATRPEAERAALAVASHHPKRDTAELAVIREDGLLSEIRIF
jgi:hypothetical protein